MFSRKEIANVCFKSNINYIIDARMGAEQLQVYTVKNYKDYLKYWYPDSDASTETCTNKGTSYCSMLSGGLVVSQIRKILTKQPYHKEFCFHIPSMNLECSTIVK